MLMGYFQCLNAQFAFANVKQSMVLTSPQISLLTAADFWRTKAITEKGIPAAKTSDGPNGARGGIFVGGTKVS